MPLPVILADCAKRCITYSLFKSCKIAEATITFLAKTVDLSYWTAMLWELRGLFEQSDPRYLLNTLYIDDYLTYLLSLTTQPSQMEQLRQTLVEFKLSEEQLGLGIKEYEAMQEEEEAEESSSDS